jgi:hypothetical protein
MSDPDREIAPLRQCLPGHDLELTKEREIASRMSRGSGMQNFPSMEAEEAVDGQADGRLAREKPAVRQAIERSSRAGTFGHSVCTDVGHRRLSPHWGWGSRVADGGGATASRRCTAWGGGRRRWWGWL